MWQASMCRGLGVRSKREDKVDSASYGDGCPQTQKLPLNLLGGPVSPLSVRDPLPGTGGEASGSLGAWGRTAPSTRRLQAGLGSPIWPALGCSLAPVWGCPGAPRPSSAVKVGQRAQPSCLWQASYSHRQGNMGALGLSFCNLGNAEAAGWLGGGGESWKECLGRGTGPSTPPLPKLCK